MDRQLYEDFNRVLNPHLYQSYTFEQLCESIRSGDEVLLEQLLLEGGVMGEIAARLKKSLKPSANIKTIAPLMALIIGAVSACSNLNSGIDMNMTNKERQERLELTRADKINDKPRHIPAEYSQRNFCFSPDTIKYLEKDFKQYVQEFQRETPGFNIIGPIRAYNINSENVKKVVGGLPGAMDALATVEKNNAFQIVRLIDGSNDTSLMLAVLDTCNPAHPIYHVPRLAVSGKVGSNSPEERSVVLDKQAQRTNLYRMHPSKTSFMFIPDLSKGSKHPTDRTTGVQQVQKSAFKMKPIGRATYNNLGDRLQRYFDVIDKINRINFPEGSRAENQMKDGSSRDVPVNKINKYDNRR